MLTAGPTQSGARWISSARTPFLPSQTIAAAMRERCGSYCPLLPPRHVLHNAS